MHVIAAKAVCLKEAMTPEFSTYQKQIVKNAAQLASELSKRGFRLVSGGTDNHLMLVDLTGKNVTGKQAEAVLDQVGITVNKNMIPFDPEKPMTTSGVRVGTPAVTSRGMGASEMQQIGELIGYALDHASDDAKLAAAREKVKALCARFPLYPDLPAGHA